MPPEVFQHRSDTVEERMLATFICELGDAGAVTIPWPLRRTLPVELFLSAVADGTLLLSVERAEPSVTGGPDVVRVHLDAECGAVIIPVALRLYAGLTGSCEVAVSGIDSGVRIERREEWSKLAL